jgi:phosphoribosylformylglycinamidine cyclo-ligase
MTQAGDAIIGLAASGPHSNGYSLIRKLLQVSSSNPTTKLGDGLLYDALLAPTRIYVKSLLKLIQAVPVRGFAHITGGGLTDNIPRVIPDGLDVTLNRQSWPRTPVFEWIQRTANISDADMHRTFNCGIGMTVCVAREHVDAALASLRTSGETAMVIGSVRTGETGRECQVFVDA